MTSLNSPDQPLKADVRGRVRVPRERREALLAEFAASGVSAAHFARLAGINYATFAGWVAKQRKQQQAQLDASGGGEATCTPLTREPVRLFEAVLEHGNAGARRGAAGLTLELPGSVRVSVESPLQLRLAAELLGLLAKTLR